jgi:hypothetical protein
MLRSAIVENLYIIGYFLILFDYLYKWHVLYPVGYNPLWIYQAQNKLNWTGVGFQISQTPIIQQQTAVVARYTIIHKNYQSMAKICVTKNRFCRRPSQIQKRVSDELHNKCTHLECKYGECHVTKIHQLVQPFQPKDCAVKVDFCHWIVYNNYFMFDTNIPEMLEYFI